CGTRPGHCLVHEPLLMMQSLYVAGDTWLHRLSAGLKLGMLFLAGAGLFLVGDPVPLGIAAVVGVALVWCSGVSATQVWRQTRGMLLLLVFVCLAAAWFEGVQRAVEVVFRLVALISL